VPKLVHRIPGAVEPIGPYSVATEAAGLIFISGQVGIDPVTSAPAPGDAAVQTRRVMDNIGIILDGVGLTFDDIVKTTVFLADIADFPAVNEVYATYFRGDAPARSTFQAGALPGGYRVEIEAIVAR